MAPRGPFPVQQLCIIYLTAALPCLTIYIFPRLGLEKYKPGSYVQAIDEFNLSRLAAPYHCSYPK
jgi:hypothetical protein